MKKRITPKARKENLVVQEADKEILIYDLSSNKAFCLNETSALIWQACNGTNDVSDITKYIGKQLNSSVNDDFVWLALDQLKKDNLIENKDEVVIDFNGMSRREVISKVAMSSLLALPIIASLATPAAAAGASCIAPPGACTPGAVDVCCGPGGSRRSCPADGTCDA